MPKEIASESNTHDENPAHRGRFQAGRSGNPRGRPKRSRTLRTELEQILTEKVGVIEGEKRRRISRQQALLLKLLEKALRGDIRAASTLMGFVLKLEPKTAEQAAPDRTLSVDDNEIIADFLRRN